MSNRARLVVLRALNLGDFLTGIPALRALSVAFAGHHRILATPARFSAMVKAERLADEVFDTHELAPLGPGLGRPDVAVDLHGRGPGSQPLLLALRPRRLIAFEHPDLPETTGGPTWRAGEHEVRRWCRLLSESGIAADETRLAITPPTIEVAPEWHGVTVVHPGAASGARRWPVERFAAVTRSEQRAGRRVVITGSSHERSLAEQVATMAGTRPKVLAGRTSLTQLTKLVAVAGRVVCGDTGIAHLATALSTPSVVLFGPVPPDEWGPPAGRTHAALWAGHRGDPHGHDTDTGLLDITVDDVRSALAELPAR
jgi:hypothetical protein